MRSHLRKLIAPIVVAVLFILYYALYFALLISLFDGVWKYLLGIVPLALGALMIKVLTERIQEIQKGEDDDLSQY